MIWLDKVLGILEPVVKRMLDPDTQERLFKIAITKKKRKALEVAETMFRDDIPEFVDFISSKIKLKSKIDKKRYARYIRDIDRAEDVFFKNNN